MEPEETYEKLVDGEAGMGQKVTQLLDFYMMLINMIFNLLSLF
jgi:hypothetical protein